MWEQKICMFFCAQMINTGILHVLNSVMISIDVFLVFHLIHEYKGCIYALTC